MFVGNVDNDGAKTNLFDPPLIAQFIRIIPVVCRKACTLRMELVGCELNGKLPKGRDLQLPLAHPSTSCLLIWTAFPPLRPGCSEPMGMKSRLVSNRQITASSVFRTWGMEAFAWRPHLARLDKQGKTNAWTAATTNRSEWLQVLQPPPACLPFHPLTLVLVLVLQVDLGAPKKISGIITQGAKDFGSVQFVSAFKVAHSDDGRSWTVVKDEATGTDKVRTLAHLFRARRQFQPQRRVSSGHVTSFPLCQIFPGNSDNNVHKKNIFDPPIYGRYIRVLPWEWHGRVTLRMELLGCDQ